tara:strand:- start:3257 stop:4534 length:1278 start_codon:yes stop_codon:yes gene_type:complete
MTHQDDYIAVVGMGYVGLPLAIEFSKKRKVIGFDIDKKRIKELSSNIDKTNEVSKKQIVNSKIFFTDNLHQIKKCNIFIITVPTPVKFNNMPDLRPLLSATKLISKVLKKKDLIIYESTVFPGATEEYCGKLIEKQTGLKINKNLFLGYSPERINPGDKKKRIQNIVKIISGSNKATTKRVSNLYSLIIKAGVHKADSIKIAEAAKVIENTQRDLNIALINELSLIFKKMNISTEKVLKAAETKWNFLSFRPGLVGGHCIGVDPYYLTFKSKQIGYHPKIILSGRSLNDEMPKNVYKDVLNIIKEKKMNIYRKLDILIMGLTFKENCPDTRNSKILELFKIFKNKSFNVSSYDPYQKLWSNEFNKKYNLIKDLKKTKKKYDIVIFCVKHKQFKFFKKKLSKILKKKSFIYDLKYQFPEKKNFYRL